MSRLFTFLNISFYSLLTFYCIVWLLTWHQSSFIVYIHEINFIVIWIWGFELSKKIGSKYILKKKLKIPVSQIIYLLLSFVFHIVVHPFYMGMIGKKTTSYAFKFNHLFFGPYLAKNINILVQIVFICIVVLLIFGVYDRYKKFGKKFIIKFFKSVIISIVVILSIFTIHHFSTNNLHLKFDKEPKSFKDFINHKELKGKYLYVDFWHTGCAPCIQDFKRYKQFRAGLTKKIKEEVAFIFIGVDRSKPGELTKQKFYIRNLNVDANHYFISKETLHLWWNELNPKEETTPQFSQYYLIKPNGKVEIRNGPKIGNELKVFLEKKLIK